MTKWDKKRAGRAAKARREQLRLTQEELAVRAGVSRSTVYSLETFANDSLRRNNLRRISTALGWTPDSLQAIGEGGDPEDAIASAPGDASGQLAQIIEGLSDLREGLNTLKQMYGDHEIRLHQVEQRDRAPRR